MNENVEKTNSDFNVGKRAEIEPFVECVLVGHFAEPTESHQIVFSAGKDNQIRFNRDGKMYHNDIELVESLQVRALLENIFRVISDRADERDRVDEGKKEFKNPMTPDEAYGPTEGE